MGRMLGTDEEGHIISESDISKLKSPWKEAVEEIKDEYVRNLGDALHGVYVRGTVSRGEAVEGISDIDTFAVLNREAEAGDEAWFKEARMRLEKKHPFAVDIELDLVSIQKVMGEKGFGSRFLIKTQSACVHGHDLSPEISPFKADKETARHFSRDISKLVSRAVLKTRENSDADDVKGWCRWIMKRMIRGGFILVMDKENAFTRDLYPSYEAFSRHYPEKKDEMRRALNFAINPTDNSSELISFIEDFGIWLADEIEREFA